MLEILLISAGAVLETLFIMRSYKRRDASSVVLKTMASVVFVLLGLLELRRMGPSLYGWYVVAGLTLGMLGDLLLALRFLSEKLHRLFFAAGSVSFFLGHIVYILAILALCPAAWLYAIPIAVVAGRGLLLRIRQGGARGQNYAARRALYRRRFVHDGLRGDGRVYRVQPGAVPVLCRRHLLFDER